MNPHPRMLADIQAAAIAVRPALAAHLLAPGGEVDPHTLAACTTTVRLARGKAEAGRAARVSVAVYITWDTRGRCRYVGSVRRPSAHAGMRARLGEHLAVDERAATWYAVTVLPLDRRLDEPVVRMCEGIVARVAHPLDGTLHPVVPPEVGLAEALATRAGLR